MGLRNVIEARGGVPILTKQAGIAPEDLLKILSNEAAPRLDMFIGILTALGYRLSIATLDTADSRVEVANPEPPIARLEPAGQAIKSPATDPQ